MWVTLRRMWSHYWNVVTWVTLTLTLLDPARGPKLDRVHISSVHAEYLLTCKGFAHWYTSPQILNEYNIIRSKRRFTESNALLKSRSLQRACPHLIFQYLCPWGSKFWWTKAYSSRNFEELVTTLRSCQKLVDVCPDRFLHCLEQNTDEFGWSEVLHDSTTFFLPRFFGISHWIMLSWISWHSRPALMHANCMMIAKLI